MISPCRDDSGDNEAGAEQPDWMTCLTSAIYGVVVPNESVFLQNGKMVEEEIDSQKNPTRFKEFMTLLLAV